MRKNSVLSATINRNQKPTDTDSEGPAVGMSSSEAGPRVGTVPGLFSPCAGESTRRETSVEGSTGSIVAADMAAQALPCAHKSRSVTAAVEKMLFISSAIEQ